MLGEPGGGKTTTLWKLTAELLAEATGQPLSRIEQDTERDYYLTAEEAKAYGLCDKVIVRRGEII